MSTHYGLHVQFTAQPGTADQLEAILVRAAEGLDGEEACRLYLVSRSPEEADVVFVTEAWTSQEAHDGALEGEETKALIAEAMPLMAAPPVATRLRPVGGKGF